MRTGAAILAFLAIVGSPVASFALDDDGDDSGRLYLNPDVLVNESVGAGSTGDFAIRGRLFSAEVTDRVTEQAAAAEERLDVSERLTFAPGRDTEAEYETVRAGLFDGYSVQALPARSAQRDASPAFTGAVFAIGVPIVILGGVLAGRAWTRRKRATG